MSTLNPGSPSSHWVAFQFLTGFGLGFGMQTSGLAIQTVLPKEDVSTGIAINFFVQQLGGAVFTSVGQTILSNLLVKKLSGIPGIGGHVIVNEGATQLTNEVPPEYKDRVLDAYNYACQRIFLAAMGLAFASLLCACGMEWKSVKKGRQGPPPSQPPATGPQGPNEGLLRPSSSFLPNGPSEGSTTNGLIMAKKEAPAEGLPRQHLRSRNSRRESLASEGRASGVLTKPPPAYMTPGSPGSAKGSPRSSDQRVEQEMRSSYHSAPRNTASQEMKELPSPAA